MLRRKCLAVSVVLIAAVVGCESGSKKHGGEKNAATLHWKLARAGVQSSLARDQYKAGNFDAARKTVDDALKLVPSSSELRTLSARIAIEQGNLDYAEKELRLAQEANPADPAPDYYYGVIMQRWQRLTRALELYTSASEKGPGEPAYILARAELLVALDRDADAIQTLQKACASFENSAEIRSALANVMMKQRRYAEAVDVFRQAVLLGADDENLREQLARALFRSNRLTEAASVLERILKSENYGNRADLYTLLGECELAAGRPLEARAAFETASNLQPQNIVYLLNLAKASLESHDLRRAEMTVRRALAISPTDSQANLLLGYVRMEQEKLPEALAAFRRATQSDSRDTTALCMSGVVLEKLGRRDEAAQHYARALDINPGDDLARQLLNQLHGVASLESDK